MVSNQEHIFFILNILLLWIAADAADAAVAADAAAADAAANLCCFFNDTL